jgi:hypothetical protein
MSMKERKSFGLKTLSVLSSVCYDVLSRHSTLTVFSLRLRGGGDLLLCSERLHLKADPSSHRRDPTA